MGLAPGDTATAVYASLLRTDRINDLVVFVWPTYSVNRLDPEQRTLWLLF